MNNEFNGDLIKFLKVTFNSRFQSVDYKCYSVRPIIYFAVNITRKLLIALLGYFKLHTLQSRDRIQELWRA